jgi:hypothetical protein
MQPALDEHHLCPSFVLSRPLRLPSGTGARRLRLVFVRGLIVALVAGVAIGSGCGYERGDVSDPEPDVPELDATPTKLDGTQSTEFEPEDVERAAGASEEVQDYCSGAVSEAQELGCLSHVDESDIP